MDEVIASLGYFAIFVGTFLEGETVLALGGVAASYGYLSLPRVIAVAVVGAFLGDQVCFFIGRRYGNRVLARFPKLAAKAPRVQALLRRWDAPAVIMLRFAYGLRIAGPIIIGTCGISPYRLAFFNLIGAILWAPLVAGVGYLAGYALHEWMGKLKNAQIAILVAAALVAAVVWIVLRRRHKTGTGS